MPLHAATTTASRDNYLSLQEKAEEINLVLLQPDVDLWRLRELALSEGGLVNDTLRKRAWPKLVGLHKYYHHNKPPELFPDEKYPHDSEPTTAESPTISVQDEEPKFEIDASVLHQTTPPSPISHLLVESMDAMQIERDVARCTWHLLTGSQRSRRIQHKNKDRKKVATLLKKKQQRLANLINLTLVESYDLAPNEEEKLSYYQGFHDVACIMLHALGGGNTGPTGGGDRHGLELPARVLCQISYSHLRDHMRNNFVSLQTGLKIALFPLLFKLDKQVHDHLVYCDMEPFFCLSWILTWFSHDVRDTNVVKRLFDAFLCSHPLFALYVSIAMMLHPYNRNQILQTDCDFAALHQCLASLPRNSCKVGWKQQYGGGYVSDEEGDDRTASTDMDSSYWDGEAERSSMTGSLPQSFGAGQATMEESFDKVPFQVLINTALLYMTRFPPRSLMSLARKYYKGEDWVVGDGLEQSISLLQGPPSWSLVSTTKADWVLKQRIRQDLGLKATSRKDRRKKSPMKKLRIQDEHSMEGQDMTDLGVDATPLVDEAYLKHNRRSIAVIAAGHGPGPEDERARRRQRRMVALAVGMGFIAIAMGLTFQGKSMEETSGESPAEPAEFSKLLPSLDIIPTENTSTGTTVPPSTRCDGVSSSSDSMQLQVEDSFISHSIEKDLVHDAVLPNISRSSETTGENPARQIILPDTSQSTTEVPRSLSSINEVRPPRIIAVMKEKFPFLAVAERIAFKLFRVFVKAIRFVGIGKPRDEHQENQQSAVFMSGLRHLFGSSFANAASSMP